MSAHHSHDEQANASMIVQKFGGTSLGSAERMTQAAQIIMQSAASQHVIVVVSAISPTVKSQGSTSLLVQAADLALKGESFETCLNDLKALHLQVANNLINDKKRHQQLKDALQEELTYLTMLLEAVKVVEELTPRSEDRIISTGERLSAMLLTEVLQAQGCDAALVDLSNVLIEHTADTHADNHFFKAVEQMLAQRCLSEKMPVLVCTGFFGMVPGGLLHTVGRGYSDFTAALISAGIGNQQIKEMQVWKEVDGIFSADPRKVPSAHLLPVISPAEAAELTYFGSEVIHPFTMEKVVAAQIPIHIRNTFKPDKAGTFIDPRPNARSQTNAGNIATAVTIKRNITVITVHSNRMFEAHGFLARIFKTLENDRVVVDLVSTSEVSISFSIVQALHSSTHQALAELGEVSVMEKRAILAVVGEGMSKSVGTATRFFSALSAHHINIQLISQGASEINISCVIQDEDATDALKVVHKAFLE